MYTYIFRVVFGYRLTRRPATVVKFHTCYTSMLCKACYSSGVMWCGVGLITFLCTCRNQDATVKRGGWGGVGWDCNLIGLAFSCTSTHTSCYADWICCYAPHARDMREHTLLGAFS